MTQEPSPETTGTRRRRTPAEQKADLLKQIKELDEQEKAQVLRLVSDAHDSLAEAAGYECAKSISTLPQVVVAVKAIIATLTQKAP